MNVDLLTFCKVDAGPDGADVGLLMRQAVYEALIKYSQRIPYSLIAEIFTEMIQIDMWISLVGFTMFLVSVGDSDTVTYPWRELRNARIRQYPSYTDIALS